jgi:CMP-N-acetylneuraminic acid synthetase
MNIVCLICARGNSKGLKNKNILDFNGVPLIARTINQAKGLNIFNNIVVSSDSQKIINISNKFGAEVYFKRPNRFAKDNSSEIDVWRHAINFFKKNFIPIDILVCLPCTSPLRKNIDIIKAVNLYKKSKCDAIIGITESARNPYFNMIKLNESKNAELLIKHKKNISRRQDAPKIFDITTNFFVINPIFVLDKKNKNYMDGVVKTINIDKLNSIDIDSKLDFEIAKALDKKL